MELALRGLDDEGGVKHGTSDETQPAQWGLFPYAPTTVTPPPTAA